MISENIRNLSASWAATWANQTSRKSRLPRTLRNPVRPVSSSASLGAWPRSWGIAIGALSLGLTGRGPSPALSGGGTSLRTFTPEAQECRLPLTERQRLGSPRGLDPESPQPCPRRLAIEAGHARDGGPELLAPELEHGLDEPEERVQVGQAHRGRGPHLQNGQRGRDLRRRVERLGRELELQTGHGEGLNRDRGQAPAVEAAPAPGHLPLHDEAEPLRPRLAAKQVGHQRPGEVVGDVAHHDLASLWEEHRRVELHDIPAHDFGARR